MPYGIVPHVADGCVCMDNIDIEKLLPHRGAMKLIDEVIEINERHCVTVSTVSPRWPLYEDGHVDPIILVELAAQTAGINFGWHEMREGKGAAKQGWLVGIKRADFFCNKIPLGSAIVVTVEEQSKNGTYATISGTAQVGSDSVGRIELQVFRPEHA